MDVLAQAGRYGAQARFLIDNGQFMESHHVRLAWMTFRKQFLENPPKLGEVVNAYYSAYYKQKELHDRQVTDQALVRLSHRNQVRT